MVYAETKAWYDMAVGQRAYRFAYLIDVVGREDEIDDGTFALLFETLVLQLELLANDDFRQPSQPWAPRAVGQVAAARRFAYLDGFQPHEEQAALRLEMILAGASSLVEPIGSTLLDTTR